MRVSELAKEMGYKAAELVEVAKIKGVKIENARATVNARMAMQVRAHVPHRSKLSGDMLEQYKKIQETIAEIEATKAATRITKPRTKRVTKKKVAEVKPTTALPEEQKPAAKKTAVNKALESKKPAAFGKKSPPSKRAKVVEEFRLGESTGPKIEKKTPVGHVQVPKEAKKPLIDVDKVIGKQTEIKAVRPQEMDRFQSDRGVTLSKEKRHAQKTLKAQTPGPPTSFRVRKPRVPPPRMRPTVKPPRPRPNIPTLSERKIEVKVPISIKDFSQETGIKVNLILKTMIEQGVMATINHALDAMMVEMLALEFEREIVPVKKERIEETVMIRAEEKDDPKDLISRAPIVTFLGHVDHGKTSLLDKIRDSKVVSGESGGITQHIGAYKVIDKDGNPVVFLDTPGHEAFTNMRARGAQVTDLAVLVVAADDGVMPQTEEAYNHAKAAGVKILVAMNKCDKPGANPNQVKGQLAKLGLNAEDWGGDTVVCEVSAITGQNINQLIEMLALEAELLDLKANPKRRATGVVLEARKSEDRGIVATVMVQNGTLRQGDVVLAGNGYGRVRAMHDDRGRTLKESGPSTPVEILGFLELPNAGDKFMSVKDIQVAKKIATERTARDREEQLLERQHLTLENLFSKIEKDKLKEVRVIVKADVKGSLEVLKEALPNIGTEEVKLRVLHASLGAVTEGDVILADASDAIIIGFHVDVEERAQELSKERGIDIRLYSVIYQAMEEMKAALEGLLEPDEVEEKEGFAKVKEVFRITRVGAVAGCMVAEGKIARANKIRLVRAGKVRFEGRLQNLKRFKDDVKEVAEGYECGMKIQGHDDIQPGDIIESIAIRRIARKLEK
jgi:translation initiation factor IF-2